MKLTKRGSSEEPSADETVVEEDDLDVTDERIAVSKGRPTPKRRDAEGRRGPVTAPKNRKEAYARQKQLAREQKSAKTAAPPRSVAEQRAALKRGDPTALPKRDQGATKKLARDYVDSHRMFSNYLLVLFPLMIIGSFIPALAGIQLAIIVLFIGLLIEWYIVGRRIRAMAVERNGTADGSPMSIGFYAGSRAYLPRRWRLPGPQVSMGDQI